MLLLEGMARVGRSVFTEREGGSDRRTVTIESWPGILLSTGNFAIVDSIVGESMLGEVSLFWPSWRPGSIARDRWSRWIKGGEVRWSGQVAGMQISRC